MVSHCWLSDADFKFSCDRHRVLCYSGSGVGPKLPFGLPAIFTGFGVPELLATASFGHILGAGIILGLANSGGL